MAFLIDKHKRSFEPRAADLIQVEPPQTGSVGGGSGFNLVSEASPPLPRRVSSVFSPPSMLIQQSQEEKPPSSDSSLLWDGAKVLFGLGVFALAAYSTPIIAVVGAMALLAGCGPLYNYGPDSPKCNGKAFQNNLIENWVHFDPPGYVNEIEKKNIFNKIESLVTNLQSVNPELLCKLNGVEITPDAAIPASTPGQAHRLAYYNSDEHKIYLTKKLDLTVHEFCHYLSYLRGIKNGGVYASITPQWEKFSCVQNSWDQTNPENCIVSGIFINFYKDHPLNVKLEEEFAEACSSIILRGAVNLSTTPNRTDQASAVLSNIGYSQEEIDTFAQSISSPRPGSIQESIATNFYLDGIAPSDISNIFSGPEGVFGFVTPSKTPLALFLSVPSLSSQLYPFYLPDVYFQPGSISLTTPSPTILYTYANNQLIAYSGGKLYFGDVPFNGWSIRKTGESTLPINPNPQDLLASLEGKPIYLGKDHYWLLGGCLESNNDRQKEYPPEIQALLAQANNVNIIYANGKSFLWIDEGSRSPVLRKKERLFQLQTLQDGSINFEKTFEIPSSGFPDKPFFYQRAQESQGHWYKLTHPTNTPFPLGAIRIENGGNTITPFQIDSVEGNRDQLTSFTQFPFDAFSNGQSLTVANPRFGFFNIAFKF